MMNPANERAAKPGRDKSSKTAIQNTKSGMGGKSSDTPNPKIQPTAEQLRLAQIINDTKESDDPELKNKIDQVIELTGKTRDEAVVALHDCDNDPNRAIDMLLDEDAYQGEWELPGKKKKNRQNSSGSRPSDGSTQNSVINNKENRNRSERGREMDKEQDGTRNRGPPRLNRGGSNRGWRGRENEKNERNLEDSRHDERYNDGRGRGRMMNGPGRGRGRGGPRSRTFQNRGSSHNTFPKSIETWTNSTADHVDGSGDNTTMSVGNWGDSFPPTEDWDNEDWTGSLAETKVFTPSVSVSSSAPPLQDSTNTSQSIDLATLLQKPSQAANSLSSLSTSQQESQFLSQYTQQATESLKTAIGIPVTSNQASSYQSIQSTTCSSSPNFPAVKFSLSPSFSANTISSSQILTSSSPPSLNSTTTCLPSGAQNSRLSSNGTVSALSQRPKSQKARLPPPSKIPSSAVEMPDDAVASLDVQFGVLEFGSESSAFEFANETTSFQVSSGNVSTSSNHVTSLASSPTTNLSTSVLPAQISNNISKTDNHSAYTPHVSTKDTLQSSLAQASQNTLPQSTLVNTLTHSQKSSGSDLNPFNAQTDRKPTPFGSQRTSQTSGVDVSLSTGKNENIGLSSSYVSQSNQSSNYPSAYQGQKSSSFGSHQSTLLSSNSFGHSSLPPHQTGLASVQSSVAPSALNTTQASTGFGVSQSQSVVSYPGQTATSSTFSTPAPTSFSNSTQPTSSSYQSQTSSSFSTQSQTTYSTQSPATYGSHQSSLSQTASTVFSSNQSQVSAYGSQTTYGSSSVSTVPSHTSLHGPVTSNSKLSSNLSSSVKESALDSSSQTYDNCHAATSTTNLTAALTTTTSSITSSSVNVSSGLNLSTNTSVNSSTSSTTKNTLSSSKTGLPSMPPGVPAVLSHQYIMSQTGLPFYGLQQAPMYSYEEMQILQQRLPLPGYYDIASFQPATSLTGRDSSLANVAYSGADGKFSRGDNASPVPTTLSQQQATTQQHQQTFINTALPPGYGYYYTGGMVPGTFPQYGTHIFPMPPVTNATNSTQFQKPTAYGSHAYNSGYDNIGQTQDYKGGYGSGSQSQSKGVGGSSSTSGGSSSGTDISGSVYSKTHNQLGKSFDKPGFPTGTPPPFNMPGTQTGPMGTPSTPYAAPFIAMMTHQQHPSPMLHHQLHPESQGPSSQRSNQSGGQQKSGSGPKQNYPPSYWAAN